MRELASQKLVGVVQLRVGSKTYAVPVQAVKFDRDSRSEPGGFFDENGQLGILVDSEASEGEVQRQIVRASAEAAQYLSKKLLN